MGEPDRGSGVRVASAVTLAPAEIAWIALLPCALLALAAIVLLGPPLGDLLFPPSADRLWPPGWWEVNGKPEPVKQARYVLAVAAPLLLASVVLVGARRELRLPRTAVRALVPASYAAVLAFVAVALLEQHPFVLPGQPAPAVFGVGMVLAAAALVAGGLLALRRRGVAVWVAEHARETPARRRAALALAVAFLAIWLLKGVMTDALTGDVVGLNLPYTLNDSLAVLNGRTPLVDYHVIYAKLLPYPTAGVLAVFGANVLVYTLWTALLNGLALLAVFAVFRLVVRSSLLALGLFVPFVAVSDVDCVDIAAGVVSPMTLTAMWPMRYAGVFLLAWLTARHVAGHWPRRPWILFGVGGLVAINSLEFGAAAVAATLVALPCARPPRSLAAAGRLVAEAAAGALGAAVLVALATLAYSGSLPKPDLLLEWPRIFTGLGWFSLPLPTWDLHLAIYATFVASVAVAAVRLARAADDALLTGMLAWSGVFGLLAGGYFIGRPDVLKVQAILGAWAFALAILTVVTVRALAAREWQRPTVPQLLVLFGFALTVCSIVGISSPTTQLERLTASRPEPEYPRAAKQFVADHTRRGEKVAILFPMSYRIAHELGLENVAPYGFMNVIVARSQIEALLDALQEQDVRKVYLPRPGSRLMEEGDTAPEQIELLGTIGYRETNSEGGLLELTRA